MTILVNLSYGPVDKVANGELAVLTRYITGLSQTMQRHQMT